MDRKIRCRHNRVAWALALAAASPILVDADDIILSTDYVSPAGNYEDLNVSQTLSVGTPASPVNSTLRADLRIYKAFGATFSSPGGSLTAASLDLRDSAANPLVFVDSANNRVGIGTSSPVMTLDVTGSAQAINLQAYADPNQREAGFVEFFSSTEAAIVTPDDNRLGPVCLASAAVGDYDLLPLYLDANPLVLQSVPKAGVTEGRPAGAPNGFGQVVIKGDPVTGSNNYVLVVGQGSSGFGTIHAVNTWTSSMGEKKDIRRLGSADHSAFLSQLEDVSVVRFRYKGEPSGSRRRLGMVAETLPDWVKVAEGYREMEAVGFLLGAAHGVADQQKAIQRRVDALKSR